MGIERVVNTQETEHIPIAPSFEIVLRIDEIPPLDIFDGPQHNVVVGRQRKKRKLDFALAPKDKPLDVL